MCALTWICSLRYAHGEEYVRRTADAAGLELVRVDQGGLRMNKGLWISGFFWLFRPKSWGVPPVPEKMSVRALFDHSFTLLWAPIHNTHSLQGIRKSEVFFWLPNPEIGVQTACANSTTNLLRQLTYLRELLSRWDRCPNVLRQLHLILRGSEEGRSPSGAGRALFRELFRGEEGPLGLWLSSRYLWQVLGRFC